MQIKNEKSSVFSTKPKWIVISSVNKPKKLSETKNFPKLTEKNFLENNSKTQNELLWDKIILGTNAFTKTKSLDFIKYRQQLLEEANKQKKKKKEYERSLNSDLLQLVSPKDKTVFSNSIKNTKSHILNDFRKQITCEDLEFEKRIDYDEKIYEKNMREAKNALQTYHDFDTNPELSKSLAFYQFEFYKNKGFKINNFNLSIDKDDYNLDEFSVARELRTKKHKDFFIKQKNIYSNGDNEFEKFDHFNRKITQKIDTFVEKKKNFVNSPTFSMTSSTLKKVKSRKRFFKQSSNKNFMFWLDLNKSQRLLMKMKEFLKKLTKLKIPLCEVKYVANF